MLANTGSMAARAVGQYQASAHMAEAARSTPRTRVREAALAALWLARVSRAFTRPTWPDTRRDSGAGGALLGTDTSFATGERRAGVSPTAGHTLATGAVT
jgi:hypothetical protein